MARTPKDELKLAAMIAAAKAMGLKGGTGAIYADGAVCAIGAKHLMNGKTFAQLVAISAKDQYNYSAADRKMSSGNDEQVGDGVHHTGGSDFDIGSAFQQAMEP